MISNGGTLEDLVDSMKSGLTENQAAAFMITSLPNVCMANVGCPCVQPDQQHFSAYTAMSIAGVSHNDVKPENIFARKDDLTPTNM